MWFGDRRNKCWGKKNCERYRRNIQARSCDLERKGSKCVDVDRGGLTDRQRRRYILYRAPSKGNLFLALVSFMIVVSGVGSPKVSMGGAYR